MPPTGQNRAIRSYRGWKSAAGARIIGSYRRLAIEE